MKTKIKKIKDELDIAWSLKVREKCRCELCGVKGTINNFDAHHIKRRGNQSTRWFVENGACLCKGCHRFKVHMDTFTAGILIDTLKMERGEDWYKNLTKRTNETYKPSIKELEDLLNNLTI